MALVQKEVKRITMRPNWSEVQIRPAIPSNSLYFEANTANSTITLNQYYNPPAVSLETSTDGATWTDYTIWTTITLSNVWDKLYMRNKSETTTTFCVNGSWYKFVMTWSIAAHWDITYLINKNTTDTVSSYCFYNLFSACTSLTLPPSLPATTLGLNCYNQMFSSCSNMVWIPELPATTMAQTCYYFMFQWCSKLKLSSTQTWSYTQPYRIPTTWTWTTASNWNGYMFLNTWWTYTANPALNTTYYVHTDNTIAW